MNKSDLVAKMGEHSGMGKKDIETFLSSFMAVVEEALVNGEKVQLVGFGTFETRQRAEREGRNPRDPEKKIKIAASKAPVFKAGKSLKEVVNGQKTSKSSGKSASAKDSESQDSAAKKSGKETASKSTKSPAKKTK